MFELTYIYHDCFFLRVPEAAIVFDFWKDPEQGKEPLPRFLQSLPEDLPLYVFVSHFHKDHFNRIIFNWAEQFRNIKFIVSKDVEKRIRFMLRADSTYKGIKIDPDNLLVISKGEIFDDALLSIHCFGSTDTGNSYGVVIKRNDLKVFHAGDLNCWTWRDESTEQEIREAEYAFNSELDFIRESFSEFDIAMFPVDSRIGTGFEEGAKVFVRTFVVKRFFPMHFTLGEDEAQTASLKKNAVNFSKFAYSRGEYIGLTEPYDKYLSLESKEINPFSMESKEISEDFNIKEHTGRWFLSAGEANAERKLSHSTLMMRLIDIATEHANILKIGNPYMPSQYMGWVLSRVTIEMNDYPVVNKDYSISTWIENWNRHFSERCFSISDADGNPVGYARQIWMVLDTRNRTNAGLAELNFDDALKSDRLCPIARQGKHQKIILREEYSDKESRVLVADDEPERYTFGYNDLDAYRHVNNVRYIDLLMNQFSLEEHDENIISRIELSFLDECRYGDTVEILKNTQKDGKSASDNEKIINLLLRRMATKEPVLFARIKTVRREVIPDY